MSEGEKEVTDYKKILLFSGIIGIAILIGVLATIPVPLYEGAEQKTIIDYLTPEQARIQEEQIVKSVEQKEKNVFDLFTPKKDEEVINLEGLKQAELEEEIKQQQEFKQTELISQNELSIDQLTEHGFDREVIIQFLLADCNILNNGTVFPALNQTETTSENGTLIENTNELLEFKKQLCQ